MRLYHKIMSRYHAAMSASLRESYLDTADGQQMYLYHWTRFVRHRDKA